tara:strand:- start:33 stop:407 length:375 start_codon:yes stop_codon:yes gene_type:complete
MAYFKKDGAPDDLEGRPPSGKWDASLCGCFADCGMCCAVFCCQPITTGQLYQRSTARGMLTKQPGLTCLTIALFLFVAEMFTNSVGRYVQDEWGSEVRELVDAIRMPPTPTPPLTGSRGLFLRP